VKPLGMLVLAVGLAVAAWWWFTREMPRREHERAVAAEAAARRAEAANSLYRWRDAAGNLHITQEPPAGRPYERVSRQPREGLEVRGGRD
jgi:hypothetical protein